MLRVLCGMYCLQEMFSRMDDPSATYRTQVRLDIMFYISVKKRKCFGGFGVVVFFTFSGFSLQFLGGLNHMIRHQSKCSVSSYSVSLNHAFCDSFGICWCPPPKTTLFNHCALVNLLYPVKFVYFVALISRNRTLKPFNECTF